jgi:cysteine desulfurase
MLPFLREAFGNPSSSLHRAGQIAAEAVAQARSDVAQLIGAETGEIIFTGGATESNNLALLGLAGSDGRKRKRIVTTAIEHKSVLGPCKELRKQGFEVIILPVNREGQIDLNVLSEAITEDTLVVSVQAASNEIGTIQPMPQITQIAHEKGVLVHCDAAQAVGKIPVDVEAWDVDLLSISAHKLYGPKGTGALYIRGGPYALPIKPLVFGGGQEHDLRSGTLNVPGIVGFGRACELCIGCLSEEFSRITILRDELEKRLLLSLPFIRRNGAITQRLPANSSLTIPGIDAEALIVNMPKLAISTGSACTSGAPEPSHVLVAIGLSRKDAYSTIRIGLGRFTSEDEINRAVEVMVEAVKKLLRT